MAWSTRRLAQLAGTTVKTIRHYHEIGLLDEPMRASNGYKQYDTQHLVRILQIARLRDLGLELAQIAELETSDESYIETLRALDVELAASIDHQQQVRAEIADLIRHRAAPDTPAGYAEHADTLTAADRAMVIVNSQLFDAQGVQDMKDIVEGYQGAGSAFELLRAEADPEEVSAVAKSLVPVLEAIYAEHPGARMPPLRARTGDSLRVLSDTITSLYNPAQVEALRQAYLLVHRPAANDDGLPSAQ